MSVISTMCETVVESQPGKIVSKTLSQKPSWACCFILIIPATLEAEVGGVQSKNRSWQKHKTLEV
jgi:hypothetical protein